MTAVLDREPAPGPDGPGLAQPGPAAHGRARRLAGDAGRDAGRRALRLFRLEQPRGRIFDEVYYACDAQNLLRYGVEAATLGDTEEDPSAAERCEPTGDPGFVAHPPLGKWAIAIGLRLFGTDELGWRIAAAVAGTLTVLVLVRVTGG
jgi:hypothetical protein